ncbi:hypothetical protein H0H81_001157 [Sphagnurus paluster]|uniref:Amino acid permease/ SLC12A domain-containing protein n=1 Tax=Sphagnurus paluster TaxID=117069 RepID=A0A9P7GQU9_9AGAR|nr:hypothetical protein H0H81_001157 [Sphagnurus paluster]
MSAANSDLYIGSRTLYGLAVEGKAPKIFKKVNRMGVPWTSLLLCTAFCGLVFLNVSSSSAKGMTSVFQRFMKALKAQGLSRDDLPYKAPFQPWGRFDTFLPFKVDTFITSYILIPVFFVLWLSYKLIYKTRIISPREVDLVTGLREIDEEEEKFVKAQEALGPQSTMKKIWDSL